MLIYTYKLAKERAQQPHCPSVGCLSPYANVMTVPDREWNRGSWTFPHPRNESPIRGEGLTKQTGRLREEFRAPAGVRKSPKHDPPAPVRIPTMPPTYSDLNAPMISS